MSSKTKRKQVANALKFLEGIDRFEDKEYSDAELSRAYREVFGNYFGQLVLWDLLSAARVLDGLNPGLPNVDARAQYEGGQRSVGLRVLAYLGYEPPKEDQPQSTINHKPE